MTKKGEKKVKVKEDKKPDKAESDGGKKKIIVIAVVAIVVIAVLAYVFVLRGDDGNGDNGNGNQKPYADFTYTPDVIFIDQTVTFDASNSTDLDDDELEYSWNFGDDNATSSNPNTDIGVTASHIYTGEGEYTVTLVVEDGKGGVDEKVENITVLIEETPTVGFTMLKPNNSLTNIIWTLTVDEVDGTADQLEFTNIRYNFYNGSDLGSAKLSGLISSLTPTDKVPPYNNPADIYFDDNGDSILSVGDTISIAGDGGAAIQTGDYFQLIYDVNQGEMMAAEGLP
jgi:PKD repeat protein